MPPSAPPSLSHWSGWSLGILQGRPPQALSTAWAGRLVLVPGGCEASCAPPGPPPSQGFLEVPGPSLPDRFLQPAQPCQFTGIPHSWIVSGLSQQDHCRGDNFQQWLAGLPLPAQVSSGKEQPQTAPHSQREGRGSGGVWRPGVEGIDCPWPRRNCWSCVGPQEPDKRTGDSSVYGQPTHIHSGSVQTLLGIK